MYWNEPSLYGVTLPFDKIPMQTPFFGQWQNVPKFIPQQFGFQPPFIPQQFGFQPPLYNFPMNYQPFPFYNMLPQNLPFFNTIPQNQPFYGNLPVPFQFPGTMPFYGMHKPFVF